MVFDYYELFLKLREPALGTNASVDIMKEHVINKSRKQIELANKSKKKISKSLKKYVGENISEQKEIEELQGILRAQQELLNVKEEIPDRLEELLVYAEDLEYRLNKHLEERELHKSTVFLRNKDGNVGISSHMLLGNIKAILATVINTKNKNIFKSKVQMNECLAMDIKAVETFLIASQDIVRDEKTQERELNIRPIRFNRMGQTISALAASEQLPAETIFNCTLRVRKESPLNDIQILKFIFSHGKNIGLGAWRNSSNHGTYDFKINKLKDYKEQLDDGWM